MPYVETTSEGTDESRDIRMVTMRIVDQLEQPQAEGDVRSAVESEYKLVPVIVERRVRSNLRALAHTY